MIASQQPHSAPEAPSPADGRMLRDDCAAGAASHAAPTLFEFTPVHALGDTGV